MSMDRPKSSVQSPAAFTIMELLVAIALTAIIMLLAARIFFETTEAVGRGISLSDVIGNAESVSDQIDLDAKDMLGPQDGKPGDAGGGVLIIVNHVIAPNTGFKWPNNNDVFGVELAKPHGPDDNNEFRPNSDANAIFRPIRSDQLVFFRNRGDQFPITPASTVSFTPVDDGGLAQYMRVWYGHVRRTQANGTSLLNATDFLGVSGDADRYANDWILGRHALFLGEDLTKHPGGALPNNLVPSAAYDSLGVGGAGFTNFALFMGRTDYAYVSLDDPLHSSGTADNGSIVGDDEGLPAYGGIPAATRDRILWATGITPQIYRQRAIDNYTFAQTRLRCNPKPGDNDFDAGQIAQMHPYFMEHVSDFVVEFAADLEDNASPATNSPAATYNPDGKIDVTGAMGGNDSNGLAYTIPAGQIKWYTTLALVNYPGGAVFDSTKPITWPVPAIYEPNREFAPAEISPAGNYEATGAFVWRHDDDEAPQWVDPDGAGPQPAELANTPSFPGASSPYVSQWPYMIRLRWRAHDKKGKLKSGDNVHGVWFEQIIHVPRS